MRSAGPARISKPFDLDELLSLVAAGLGGRGRGEATSRACSRAMAERAGSERADGVYRAYDERAITQAAITRAIRRVEERGGRRGRGRTVGAFLLSALVGFVLGAGCVTALIYAAVQVSQQWQWQWLTLFLG